MGVIMELFILLVSAIICYLISTLIHELGHVVCGLLHHWKLFLLVVGPVKLYRESMDSEIKVGIEKNPVLWCGVGGTLPTRQSEENLKIWAKILLAGPLTSIVFGVLMIPVFIFTKIAILLMFCLMPIAMGAMCIIPMKMKTGFLYNDGTRYKRLRSGGQEGEEERAIFRLIEVGLFGGKDVIYPTDLVEPLLCSADLEFNYYGYYYTYRNALQEGNAEEAGQQLENMERIRGKVSKMVVEDCKIICGSSDERQRANQ